MKESFTSGQDAEQEAPVQAEVIINGKVFKKTVLPSVTREDFLNKRGGVKKMPKKRRELTDAEAGALNELKRDERSIYDRKFSDYGGPVNDNAPHDVSWDNSNRVNGAHMPDDSLLNEHERHEQQE